MCLRLAAFALVLAPALGIVPGAAAQEPVPVTDPLAERVHELVGKLASDEFAVRKKAYRHLSLIARRALEILKTYRNHEDPEVARLIGQLVTAQARERRNALLGPLDTQDNDFAESLPMAKIVARGRAILDALHGVLDEEDACYPRYSYWRMRNTYAAIGALARDEDIERLIERMRHPNIHHRLMTQQILERLDRARVLEEFRSRLVDPKENGRVRAQILEICRGSNLTRNEKWIPEIAKKLLEDTAPEVRIAAVRWFALRRDEEMLPKILEMARDEEADVRTEVMRSLRSYRGTPGERALRAGLTDTEGKVRAAALETLRGISGPELAPVVRPFLKDPDPMVRSQAARALGQMGDRAALPVLIELLTLRDEGFLTQGLHAVVDALGRLRDPAALTPLFKLLDDAPDYRQIEIYRYHILSNIVLVGGAGVIDRIKSQLLDPTMQNGHIVLDALASVESEKVIPFLMKALEEGDTRYRTSAVRALAARGHRAAGPLLVTVIAEEEDPWFLTEALRALTAFGVNPGPKVVLGFLDLDPGDVRNINLIYGAMRASTRFGIRDAAPKIVAILEKHAARYSYRAVDTLGRLDDPGAIPILTKLLAAEKYDARKHRTAIALARLGALEPLLARLRAERMTNDPSALATRAESFQALGREEDALAAVNQALSSGEVNGTTLYNLGCVLSLMGKKDRAIRLLLQSQEARVMYRRLLAEDPDLDALRDDPRFQEILQKAK